MGVVGNISEVDEYSVRVGGGGKCDGATRGWVDGDEG